MVSMILKPSFPEQGIGHGFLIKFLPLLFQQQNDR
jgi:hypothetical protein